MHFSWIHLLQQHSSHSHPVPVSSWYEPKQTQRRSVLILPSIYPLAFFCFGQNSVLAVGFLLRPALSCAFLCFSSAFLAFAASFQLLCEPSPQSICKGHGCWRCIWSIIQGYLSIAAPRTPLKPHPHSLLTVMFQLSTRAYTLDLIDHSLVQTCEQFTCELLFPVPYLYIWGEGGMGRWLRL